MKEAFNAISARALLVTWLPTTTAMSVAIAAAKGNDVIRFVPFVLAIAICFAVPFAMWRVLRLDWLRGTITALIIVVALTAADVLFLKYGQEHVVALFLATANAKT